jgi:hypothetical protein
MRNLYRLIGCTLLLFALYFTTSPSVLAQCSNTMAGGQSGCARSNFYYGEILPSAGCGVFTSVASYGPGYYFRIPVLAGGCYTISTCGTSVDTHINAFEGVSTTLVAWDDDNGPLCSGFAASINMTPSFTDYARVDVREYPCSPGGSASITVNVRQNNNLVITSSSAAMCENTSRVLSATPASVSGALPGSGDAGTFTGTGVSGGVFNAPAQLSANANYNITYTFGYCSTSQQITVYHNPSLADAGPNQVVCASSTTLSANPPIYGNGQWTVLSGPGSVVSPTSFNSPVSGLVPGQPTTLRWTVSNGPCSVSMDSMVISRDADPTVALCGFDQNVCTDSIFLSANSPAVGVGSWVLMSGSGNIQSPNNSTSLVSGLGFGPNAFVWTISNGVCNSTSDTLILSRDTQSSQAFAGPDKQICGPNTSMAGNLPSVGNGLWTVLSGSGVLSNPNQPNATISGMNLGTTALVWTITNGTCPPRSDTVLVTRNPTPIAPVVSGNQNVCFGFPATLTASSSASSPTYTWWDAAAGGNLIAAGNVYNSPPLGGPIVVYCEVSDGNTTCSSSRTQYNVSVNPLPVVHLGTDTVFCSSDSVCLDAGPGLTTYNWNSGATSRVFCTNVSGTYWVEVTNSNGCHGTDTVNLLANTPPVVNLGPNVTLCTGSQYTIGVPSVTGQSYLWSNGAQTNNIAVSNGGPYSITVTDANNCDNADSILVNQYNVPVASFAIDTSDCPIVSFSDQSTDASTWIWSFGNGASSVNQNPNYSYQSSGNNTYTVTLIVNGICGSDTTVSAVEIDCIVGVDVPDNLSITVYPNPNDGMFKIHFDGLNDDVSFSVVDVLGQEIYSKAILGQRGSFDEMVNVQGVAAGNYFVKMKIGDITVTKRFVVR